MVRFDAHSVDGGGFPPVRQRQKSERNLQVEKMAVLAGVTALVLGAHAKKETASVSSIEEMKSYLVKFLLQAPFVE